jgi:hypothetical protein
MGPISIGTVLASIGSTLLEIYRRPIVLGSAILGFSICGLGMIIGSHALTGWWQAALLGFGISLLVVGTVELGILGIVKKLTEPDDKPSKAVRTVSLTVSRTVSTTTAATLPEIAAILRELANRLESSTAEPPSGDVTKGSAS